MRVLVLGGTGVVSRAIVDELLAKGHEVVLFNRGSRKLNFKGKVEELRGDRSRRDEFESFMQRKRFGAVIDMICFNAEDAASSVRAFRGRTDHLIVTSTVAAYKRPYKTVPTIEDQEMLIENPAFSYGFHKAEMERYLQAAIQEEVPISIIRPSLTFGPGAANVGVLRQNYGVIDRIKKGKPLVMFGDGTTPWNFTFAPDLAKAFAGILGNGNAIGKTYHVTNEERHIWEDLYLEFGNLVGREPIILHIPSELLYKAAPNLCGHLLWEKSYSGLFDNSKIKRDVPGYRAEIPLAEGLKALLDWYEKDAESVDEEKDTLEDKLVEIYMKWASEMNNLYTK